MTAGIVIWVIAIAFTLLIFIGILQTNLEDSRPAYDGAIYLVQLEDYPNLFRVKETYGKVCKMEKFKAGSIVSFEQLSERIMFDITIKLDIEYTEYLKGEL